MLKCFSNAGKRPKFDQCCFFSMLNPESTKPAFNIKSWSTLSSEAIYWKSSLKNKNKITGNLEGYGYTEKKMSFVISHTPTYQNTETGNDCCHVNREAHTHTSISFDRNRLL